MMMATASCQNLDDIVVKTGLEGDEHGNGAVFTREISLNENKNRYRVTPVEVQREIMQETGVHILVRGKYYPDRKLATEQYPPLHMQLTASDRPTLEQAVKRIELLLKDRPPPAMAANRDDMLPPETSNFSDTPAPPTPSADFRPEESVKLEEVSVPIEMENIRGFHLKAKIVGQSGANIKHIEQKSKAKVQIRGNMQAPVDSFGQSSTTSSAEEPSFHISAPTLEAVKEAETLCRDLLATVRVAYDSFVKSHKENSANQQRHPPQHHAHHSGGYGNHHHGHQRSYKSRNFQVSSYPAPGATLSNSPLQNARYSRPRSAHDCSMPSSDPAMLEGNAGVSNQGTLSPPVAESDAAASYYQYYYNNPAYYAYYYQYYYGNGVPNSTGAEDSHVVGGSTEPSNLASSGEPPAASVGADSDANARDEAPLEN